MLELLPSKFTRQVSNIKRFNEEFGPPEPDAEEKDRFNRKPSLYKDVFSGKSLSTHVLDDPRCDHRLCTGNFDDNFRLGIKLGKRSVKLFADFYAVRPSAATGQRITSLTCTHSLILSLPRLLDCE